MKLSEAIERGAAIAASAGVTGKSKKVLWHSDENNKVTAMCALGYAATGIVGHILPVWDSDWSNQLAAARFNSGDLDQAIAMNDVKDYSIQRIIREIRFRETQRSNEKRLADGQRASHSRENVGCGKG